MNKQKFNIWGMTAQMKCCLPSQDSVLLDLGSLWRHQMQSYGLSCCIVEASAYECLCPQLYRQLGLESGGEVTVEKKVYTGKILVTVYIYLIRILMKVSSFTATAECVVGCWRCDCSFRPYYRGQSVGSWAWATNEVWWDAFCEIPHIFLIYKVDMLPGVSLLHPSLLLPDRVKAGAERKVNLPESSGEYWPKTPRPPPTKKIKKFLKVHINTTDR